MQLENKHEIEGVLFSSSELKNNETVLTVLEEARKLRERPEVLATLGYILEKTNSAKHTWFVNRMVTLEISRTTEHKGIRFRRYSEKLYSGEDLYYIRSIYRRERDNCKEEC